MLLGKKFYRLSRVAAPYTPPPPVLSIARASVSSIPLFWPADDERSFTLQFSTSLNSTNWAPVPSAPAVVGTNYLVTDSPAGVAKFYRLGIP